MTRAINATERSLSPAPCEDWLRRPSTRWPIVYLVGLIVLHGPGESWAQEGGLTLDQYRAAESPQDGFALSRPNDQGHFAFGAQIYLDYGYRPLEVEYQSATGETFTDPLVAHQLVGTVGLAFGLFHRLVVFGGLHASLVMEGDEDIDVPGTEGLAADGAAMGDVYLGARVRLVGTSSDIFSLGFQGRLVVPTAKAAELNQRYAGEKNFAGSLELLAEVRPGPVRVTANLGARLREGTTLADLSTSHELTWGLGVGYRVVPALELVAETYGSTSFADFGDRRLTPAEAIGGLRWSPGLGFVIGAAAGAGLTPGLGSPAARAVLTVGWASAGREANDDPDGDGITGSNDECPDEPEDFDGAEDYDGCPEADEPAEVPPPLDPCQAQGDEEQNVDVCPDGDADGDGHVNAHDGCPTEAEDADGHGDDDGCPDPDNDGDGQPDESDQCPNVAEDADNFQDQDGCPDPDNDGDGVLDGTDECPLAPGSPDAYGCPLSVRLSEGQIQLLQQLRFALASFAIQPDSFAVLREVAQTLEANPGIQRVRIEGHTDSSGTDENNLRLSRQRADAVRSWLVEHGVDAARLEAQGLGESRPIVPNDTAENRQKNRRVEFHIETVP